HQRRPHQPGRHRRLRVLQGLPVAQGAAVLPRADRGGVRGRADRPVELQRDPAAVRPRADGEVAHRVLDHARQRDAADRNVGGVPRPGDRHRDPALPGDGPDRPAQRAAAGEPGPVHDRAHRGGDRDGVRLGRRVRDQPRPRPRPAARPVPDGLRQPLERSVREPVFLGPDRGAAHRRSRRRRALRPAHRPQPPRRGGGDGRGRGAPAGLRGFLTGSRPSSRKAESMADFVGALDQGTTSTRFMIFDHGGNEVARHQLEHEQIMPRAGWVEHNPTEIWERTRAVVQTAMNRANLTHADLAAFGITNQRETAVVWNRRTGRPYYNAIVWQDTRTDRIASALERDGRGDTIRHRAGLPPATYFSGGKVQWILENVDGVREAAEKGDAVLGTGDTWALGNLTGGPDGGVHVTDPTNASRTMLMDLETLDWDDELLSFFGIPRQMLPEIRPSSAPEPYGVTRADGPVGGEVPLTGILGDQQAATVGQVCFAPGEAKNTYGTGNFL